MMNKVIHLAIILIGLSSFRISDKSIKYNWQKIKEFKFHGFEDPSKNENEEFIIADIEKIKNLFLHVKGTKAYFPKGANRFATITFEDNTKIVIQIIAGGDLIFRVIKNDLLNDDWYNLNEKNSIGVKYLEELTEKLQKFNR